VLGSASTRHVLNFLPLDVSQRVAVVEMDWERKSLDWVDHDFSNFRYGARETTVVAKLAINEVDTKLEAFAMDKTLLTRWQSAILVNLTTNSDWDSWFNSETSSDSS